MDNSLKKKDDMDSSEANSSPNTEQTKGNGTNIIAAIALIVTLLVSMYAITDRLSQRVDFLYRSQQTHIDKIMERLDIDDVREREDNEKLSEVIEKFNRVETQFESSMNTSNRMQLEINHFSLRDTEIKGVDSRQDEKISSTEKDIDRILETIKEMNKYHMMPCPIDVGEKVIGD